MDDMSFPSHSSTKIKSNNMTFNEGTMHHLFIYGSLLKGT